MQPHQPIPIALSDGKNRYVIYLLDKVTAAFNASSVILAFMESLHNDLM